ncbi:nucleoside recognition domain-containing protein [Paenibacillus sp. KS-LC4]|uniref:nucleoside recognition domain-containing protein n=1 Tax=Paenibacillus sp. KS-LC4 TaxID=2979727 RepID=UPI0030D20C51
MAKTLLAALASILLVGAVIYQSEAAFQASLQALTLWWNIVFPGLLPFLVLFELITAFGLVHGIGVLLQPLMRRLFRLPGEAALPLLFGWLSGFPAGAETTAMLRRHGQVTLQEGQRLLAFSHMPNPIFMLVVLGAGFMHRPELGLLIAAAVWLAALWTAWLLLLTSRSEALPSRAAQVQEGRLIERAAKAITAARESDGRSFGRALGEAVSGGVQKLMLIGGLIIFTAVIARLMLPLWLSISSGSWWEALFLPALLESHIGTYTAAVLEAPSLTPVLSAAITAAILAWSGISGLLQAGYSTSGTELKLLPLAGAKLLHAAHAAWFVVLLWKPGQLLLASAPFDFLRQAASVLPVFSSNGAWMNRPVSGYFQTQHFPNLWPYTLASSALLLLLFLLAALYMLARRKADIPK